MRLVLVGKAVIVRDAKVDQYNWKKKRLIEKNIPGELNFGTRGWTILLINVLNVLKNPVPQASSYEKS